MWGDTFADALAAHAAAAYKAWLALPADDVTGRRGYVEAEFALCRRVGWSDLYAHRYLALLHEIIDAKVEATCKGDYQSEFLTELNHWAATEVLPFAAPLLTAATPTSSSSSSSSGGGDKAARMTVADVQQLLSTSLCKVRLLLPPSRPLLRTTTTAPI